MHFTPPSLHPSPTISSAADLRARGRTPPDPRGGPFKGARFPRAATNGGGTISKSEDGERCVISGRECELLFALCWSFVGNETAIPQSPPDFEDDRA
jgi:hypothetical protein